MGSTQQLAAVPLFGPLFPDESNELAHCHALMTSKVALRESPRFTHVFCFSSRILIFLLNIFAS
jgi:hypothetical protein